MKLAKRSSAAEAGTASKHTEAGTASKPSAKDQPKDGARETVESIVIAFVLAFLFRTFEAEAFVIPTGSMAPTLMGQHRDVACRLCHIPFQVNASQDPQQPTWTVFTCPNCALKMEYAPDTPQHKRYKGDRILVAKFPYEFADPKRWDVAVFKYPLMSKQNYIKRVVGLPNETVRIWSGDISTMPEGATDFVIERKPPYKQLAMLQLVYDNDYQNPELNDAGWPQRWQADAASASAWRQDASLTSFEVEAPAGGESRLVYRHLVPSPMDWETILGDRRLGRRSPLTARPQLITDFYAYNTGDPYASPRGLHWVGDLALKCELEAVSGDGQATLELVEGGRVFRCTFDLGSGRATLGISGVEGYSPHAETDVRAGTTHEVVFVNADDQLQLFIDGTAVAFDVPTTYDDLSNDVPTVEDLSPARIAAQGARLRVSHLRIERDIYYIADFVGSGNKDNVTYDYLPGEISSNFGDGVALFADPARLARWRKRDNALFPLGPDQFLMLGDNSPRSKDSRLWSRTEYYVDRSLLVGKAFYIYWPHALDHIPGTNIWFPLFPNFGRMGLVR